MTERHEERSVTFLRDLISFCLLIILVSSGCNIPNAEVNDASPAVITCKANGGFWRWGEALPKSSGECIRKTKDANKSCTDSDECQSHYCAAINCNDVDSCKKQASGQCLGYLGSRLGCRAHFEKGKVVEDTRCGDSMGMYIDGTP